MKPRDYQEYASNSVLKFFSENQEGNPLVVMPTGTGKSIVIADLLRKILSAWCTQRILILTHVKELIEQNHDKLMQMWPNAPAGIYSAGLGRKDTMQNVIFGGIASVVKAMAQLGRFDLVFVDECHLVNPEETGMYRKLFNFLKETNPYLRVVGFTATPYKLGYGSIVDDGLFTDICCDMSSMEAFNWLVEQCYLAPLVTRKVRTKLDIDGVHMRGGEFIPAELQAAVNKEEITRAALQEAVELGADRKHWLVFAAGVEHACDIANMLNNEFGISAIAIHGKMSKTERDNALRDYKAGKYRVAVNNNILTTGFDFPHIDLIVVLRPTASTVLWVQMLGRGTRPVYADGYDLTTHWGRYMAMLNSAKQNCLVLDYAGNTRRLGAINDPVKPRKKGEKVGEAPVKECMCGVMNHASARFCGGKPKDHPQFDAMLGCGEPFEFQTKIQQTAADTEVMKPKLPVVEVFKVDHIAFAKHSNANGTMARVTYYCGYTKQFTEYIGVDHPNGGARTAARRWWSERSVEEVPTTTDDLLQRADSLAVPTHIRVWVNQKYPKVMAACFDGTAFGTEQPPAAGEAPTVQVHSVPTGSRGQKERVAANFSDMDDDIPF